MSFADLLTTDDVARLAGVKPSSIRRYRTRDSIPEPDRYVGRTPVWRRETVEQWLRDRPKPGRPRTD